MDGIHSVHGAYLYPPPTTTTPAIQAKEPTTRAHNNDHEPEQKKMLTDMQVIGSMFNTRLEYRYHESLRQVVVKVFDSDTDTLIKELPSAELQAVYLRIKEVLGLMMDKQT